MSESADWASWLDRFEREVWPSFRCRGYSKDAAATIYFTRFPETDAAVNPEDEAEG